MRRMLPWIVGGVVALSLASAAHAGTNESDPLGNQPAAPSGGPPGLTPPSAGVATAGPVTTASGTGADGQRLAPLPAPVEQEPSMLGQFVLGGFSGAAGAFVGGAAGYYLDCAAGCRGDFAGLGGLLLGGALGLTAGTTAGVAIAGHDPDHDSSIALTWLGSAVGAGAGLALAAKIDGSAEQTITVLGGAALGATILHQVSRTRRASATAIRLVPSMTSGGVQLSLVATGL